MANQVEVAFHRITEVRFEHRTLDAGKPTEFRMLDFHLIGEDGEVVGVVKTFSRLFDAEVRRTPIVLRPLEEES